MRIRVQNMTDDEFETNINAIKTILSEKEKNLSEDFERVFGNELSIHAYQFDRRDKQLALIATFTKADFQQYFE